MNRCISAGIVLVLLAVACSPGTAQVTWTRYGTTPVLQPTYDIYCGFDYSRVVEPYVMKEGPVYRMWYFGNTGIGDALSLDGAHWYKNTANPVLADGRGPTVVHDHSGYKMYYFTFGEWSRVINLATSEDGNSWTPYPGNPVISWESGKWDSVGVFYPCVVFEDSIYKMWYQAYDMIRTGIGYATSADGFHWTKYGNNPLITLGDSVGQTRVLWSGKRYDMLYTTARGVHYASSKDGIDWSIYGSSPVLATQGTSWERTHVAASGFVWTGVRYEQWYSAEGDPGIWTLGFATAPMDTSLIVEAGAQDPHLIPQRTELRDPYPNPFNPSVQVSFMISSTSYVRIDILDLLGRKVATVAEETVPAGDYSRTWQADRFASGVYFCRLEATSLADHAKKFVQTKKLMLVK